MMKKLTAIIALALLACSCQKHQEVLFDTPFAWVLDSNGGNSMTVSKDANNLMIELVAHISASANYFQEPIELRYDLNVGEGLTEGVDFRIQESTRSPLVFKPGVYTQNIRIIWMRNQDFDTEKDGELKIELSGSSVEDMVMGYPGPAQNRKSYIFTKK